MSGPWEGSRPIIFPVSLLIACLLFCGIASAAPSITLSKKSGPPTSKILVSGRGFAPHVGVDIYFGTKDDALVITDGKGDFKNAKIHAPREARPGKHWVTALERDNDKGAQRPFLVQTDWNQFDFDADGTRVNPYENVLNPRTVGGLGLEWRYLTHYYAKSSMAIADGVVYVGPSDSYVYALNAGNGALLWRFPTSSAGGVSSPAVKNGVVYVASFDSNVYALNARTGVELWSYLNGSEMSSPAVANGVVYIGSRDYNVYALNARTGAKLWNYPTGSWVDSSPTVVDGVVYVGSFDNNVYALDALTGDKRWSYATGGPVASSPVVANGTVYVGSADENVYALNAQTGTKLWSYATGNTIESSPAVANGVVYIGSRDYNVYALNARTGAKLWNYPTGSWVDSSPAVSNGVVYIGSLDGNVYALNAGTGVPLWSYTTGSWVYSSLTVADGKIYFGAGDFNIYSFGLTKAEGERDDERRETVFQQPSLTKPGPTIGSSHPSRSQPKRLASR